jgi:high-affinity iron transporter
VIATLVIGLREGLEAALIVSIIAAFLRRNGRSLMAMWIGVVLAVVLSIAVGVVLAIVEQSLPQAGQEGMEAIIGAVAIFFVTGMVFWMNTHARAMKRDLEAEAAQALGDGRSRALAVMAFLAVLKEGFETAVFLLATFSAAQSAALAATGAVVGILLAVLIGAGIYFGGVRINLSRFFRITGGFLILVAAGLVMTALRSAHEAGWLIAGQQPTVNLTWLVRPGSVQSALITGVLGIQPDPRLVEVVGWFTYLIPVALIVYWPSAHRPGPRAAATVRLGVAAGLVIGAAVLAVLVPAGHPADRAATIASATGRGIAHLVTDGSGRPRALHVVGSDGARSRVPLGLPGRRVDYSGVTATQWRVTQTSAPVRSTITLDRLVSLNGGRAPVGFDVGQDRGPFTARRTSRQSNIVWVSGGLLLDAFQHSTTLVTLSGGGLSGTRTISLGASGDWHVTAGSVQATLSRLSTAISDRLEHRLWGIDVPIAMVLVALLLVAMTFRSRRRTPTGSAADPVITTHSPPASPPRSNTHAVQ